MTPRNCGIFVIVSWIIAIFFVSLCLSFVIWSQFQYNGSCILGECQMVEVLNNVSGGCKYKFYPDKSKYIVNDCPHPDPVCQIEGKHSCLVDFASLPGCPVKSCYHSNYVYIVSSTGTTLLLFWVFGLISIIWIRHSYLRRQYVYHYDDDSFEDVYSR